VGQKQLNIKKSINMINQKVLDRVCLFDFLLLSEHFQLFGGWGASLDLCLALIRATPAALGLYDVI
jgi:hypothetical protein